MYADPHPIVKKINWDIFEMAWTTHPPFWPMSVNIMFFCALPLSIILCQNGDFSSSVGDYWYHIGTVRLIFDLTRFDAGCRGTYIVPNFIIAPKLNKPVVNIFIIAPNLHVVCIGISWNLPLPFVGSVSKI